LSLNVICANGARAAEPMTLHDAAMYRGIGDDRRTQIVFEPMALMALSVPSAASAATAKYQVPEARPVIS